MRFTGTTVVITGAAGGLGSAMAAAFAAEGGRVAVLDLPGSDGAGVAERINDSGAAGSAFFVPCDLADLERAGTALRRIAADGGRIVNVSSITFFGGLARLVP